MKKIKAKFLKPSEIKKLTNSFISSRRKQKRNYTDYELSQIVEWGEKTKLRSILLKEILKGHVEIGLEAGEEIVFKHNTGEKTE